jgi:hypothetical protein
MRAHRSHWLAGAASFGIVTGVIEDSKGFLAAGILLAAGAVITWHRARGKQHPE